MREAWGLWVRSAVLGGVCVAAGVVAAACSSGTDESPPGASPPSLCGGGSAEPTLQPGGDGSGFVACVDGTVHREGAVTCEPVVGGSSCVGDEDSIACTSDADCTERPHGRCISKLYVGGGTSLSSCSCQYPCADDGDCEADEICLCAGVRSSESARCIPALCRTNADCPGGECSLSLYEDGCGPQPLLACRSSADTCRVESDCTEPNRSCEAPIENPYEGAGAGVWQCEQRYCIS